ncbi:MAG: protein TolR [Desulforhopalus sp.]|nr:protein TolR [Desulforhopalus sp.]
MGMSTGGRRGSKRLVSDINITPLVDVMLVLLIIFMVTAPMMTQGLNVDLPKVTGKALVQKETPITITLMEDGTISINKLPLTRALMINELQKKYAANKNQAIYLMASTNVPYGHVVQIMADIKTAGFDQIGMVTEPPDKE